MDYIDQAEKAIQTLKNNAQMRTGPQLVTTSQIRRFLTAVNALSGKIDMYKIHHEGEEKLPRELQAEVKYLKVKLAYQIGRDDKKSVKAFADETHLFEKIDGVKDSIENYEEFARYIEALVAYHKYYGGKN